jgi:hypothetical protein
VHVTPFVLAATDAVFPEMVNEAVDPPGAKVSVPELLVSVYVPEAVSHVQPAAVAVLRADTAQLEEMSIE